MRRIKYENNYILFFLLYILGITFLICSLYMCIFNIISFVVQILTYIILFLLVEFIVIIINEYYSIKYLKYQRIMHNKKIF